MFVGGVVDRVGMEGFNQIWESPANLPRLEELSDPAPGWRGCTAARPSPPEPLADGRPAPAVAQVRSAVRPGLTGLGRGRCSSPARGGGLARAGRRRRLRGAAGRGAGRRGDRRPRPAGGLGRAGRGDGGAAARPRPRPGARRRRSTVGRPTAGRRRPPATARYAALADGGRRARAPAIALGHTRDDQAETVLLGLGRGSGPRSVAGMVEQRAPAACLVAAAARRPPGDDPRGLRRAGPARLGRPAQRRPGLHPGRGCGPRCCRCSRRCSAAAWRRPGPDRGAAARGPRRARRAGRRRAGRGWPAGRRRCRSPRRRRAARRAAQPGAARLAARRAACPTCRRCTWPPSTRCSSAGGGRAGWTCPAARASSGRLAGWSCCAPAPRRPPRPHRRPEEPVRVTEPATHAPGPWVPTTATAPTSTT